MSSRSSGGKKYLIVAALVVVLSVAGVTRLRQSSAATVNLGAYFLSNQSYSLQAQRDSTVGHKNTLAMTYSSRDTWDQVITPNYMYKDWQNFDGQMVFTTAMLPVNGSGTMEACAAGSYNDKWRTYGSTIKSYGYKNAIIRLGWEFNGGWFAFNSSPNPATWKKCWQNIVTSASSTAPDLLWDWCVNNKVNKYDANLYYPGDQYVDIVGIDAFDAWSPVTSESGWESSQVYGGTLGLKYWRDFAVAHNKYVSIPEWGVGLKTSNWDGGGDNPLYIQKMFEFISNPANRVLYEAYTGNYYNFTIPPKSLAKYKELFGPYYSKGTPIKVDGSTPTTPADPPPTNPTGKTSDLNADGKVNLNDLSMLLSKWNQSNAAADLNSSGKVDLPDLSILLANWTK